MTPRSVFFKELPKGSQDPRAAEVYEEAIRSIRGLQTFEKYDELLDLIESRHADNIPLLSVIAPGSFSFGYKIGNRFTRGTPARIRRGTCHLSGEGPRPHPASSRECHGQGRQGGQTAPGRVFTSIWGTPSVSTVREGSPGGFRS